MKAKKKGSKAVKKYTAKEKQVLALLLQRFTNEQIAERLNRSVRTIEGHRQSIMKKTGATSFAELVAYFHKDLEKKLMGKERILDYTYSNIYQMYLLSYRTIAEIEKSKMPRGVQFLPNNLQKAS